MPVKIYVSDGPTEQYQRAQLFDSCVNKEVDEVRALLTAAGYNVDEGVDMQPSESVTYNHVICVGLVRETEVNGEKVEEIVTGDDVPLDIKRVRLTVSSGPETSGDSSTPVSITRQKLGPSWSVLDPASGVSDAKLINGTYPTWYPTPKKIDNAKYLTGDAQTTRFTNYSTGSNDGHHYGHSGCWGSSVDETSGDLAIGYKSQGSFLVDFRQVDTTPQTNLGNITYHPNWHSGYDPSPARAGVSSVAPETTFFMEQGNSNFYPTRCQGCYSNWSYYDKNSRWVYGSGFVDDGTYRDVAGNIDDQYHYHSGSNYYGNHFCYDWANGNPRFNTVGSYTYNTGAHLEMVQDISGEGFDAYYVKIKQQALSYLDKVTVKFSDGQQMVIDGNTIRAQYYDSLNKSNNGGVATSVQLDNQGNYFFRLNLMKVVDASGNPVDLAANPKAAYAKHVPSYGKEDAYAYRDTFNDYADGVPTFRVTQIVYDVTINQGTLASNGYPKVPDYGQWFADSLGASSAEWSKNMSFEVTGRFIRTDQATSATAANTVTSTTTMNMTIGGEYSGEKYVHAAAQRYDSPNQRAVYNGNEHDGATSETLTSRANNSSWRGNARNIYRDIATTFSNMGATGAESLNFYYDEYGRGSWSYKNFHRSGQCCHDGWCSYHGCYHHHYHFYQFDEGKMRHLRTSSRMIAYESRNFVQKSVNRDAGSIGWAGNTNVSDNHSDQRIFADDEGYFMSLYRWEPGGNDTNYGDHQY